MTRTSRTTVAGLLLTAFLAGCASHDFGNVELLGAASDHNLRLQSIRDVDAPNLKGVEGGEGGRAAAPIERLREGQAEDLSPMSGT